MKIEYWIINIGAFTFIGLVYVLIQTVKSSNKKDKIINDLIDMLSIALDKNKNV